VNHGELSQCFKHDDSTINIVEVLLLLLLLLLKRLLCTWIKRYNDRLRSINTLYSLEYRRLGTYTVI